MDIADTVAPKSDQMNADDLVAGPVTLTITKVDVFDSPNQPVHVHFAEWPDDRPWKPNLGMRRILVAVWGAKSAAYAGKRITLYRDESVTWAGEAIGGIRIGAMSGIERARSLPLTVSQKQRKLIRIDPLPDAPAGPSPVELAARVAEGLEASTTEAEITEWANRAESRGLLDLSPAGAAGTIRELVQARLAELVTPKETA